MSSEEGGGATPPSSPRSSPSEEEEDEAALFSCHLRSCKEVTTVLSCLSHGSKKSQHVRVEVTQEGLTFIVTGSAKASQAQGMLQAELFTSFECEEEGGDFSINLTTLLDCLQVFGPFNLSSTSLSMSYYQGREIFKVTLEEGGVFTSCEINTLHQGGDSMELKALATAFMESTQVCRCILKSEHLKEAFQELSDVPGAAGMTVRLQSFLLIVCLRQPWIELNAFLTKTGCTYESYHCSKVAVSKASPNFRLSTAGSLGTCEIDFPKESEAFVHFSCTANAQFIYALTAMVTGMKALQHAEETYFRVNEEGIMCIQHQLNMANGQSSFIDFLICATEEELLSSASE